MEKREVKQIRHWELYQKKGERMLPKKKKIVSIAGWLSRPFVGMDMGGWEAVIGNVTEM